MLKKLKKFFSIRTSMEAIDAFDASWLVNNVHSIIMLAIIGSLAYFVPDLVLYIIVGAMLGQLIALLFVCIKSRRKKEVDTIMNILGDKDDVNWVHRNIQSVLNQLPSSQPAMPARPSPPMGRRSRSL